MPKSPTERINELERTFAILDERLSGIRREVEVDGSKIQRMEDALHGVKRDVAVVEERLAELKRVVELNSQRRWAVVPSLVGALLGTALGFLSQLAIRRWFTP